MTSWLTNNKHELNTKPKPITELSNDPTISNLANSISTSLRLLHNIHIKIDSIQANKYRNMSDHLPYHSQNEHILGPNPITCLLTLGAPRTLKFRKNSNVKRSFELPPGSLIVLTGRTNIDYIHSIPKSTGTGESTTLILRSTKIDDTLPVPPHTLDIDVNQSLSLTPDISKQPQKSKLPTQSSISPTNINNIDTKVSTTTESDSSENQHKTRIAQSNINTEQPTHDSPMSAPQLETEQPLNTHTSPPQKDIPKTILKSKFFKSASLNSSLDSSSSEEEHEPPTRKTNTQKPQSTSPKLLSATIKSCIKHMPGKKVDKELQRNGIHVNNKSTLEHKKLKLEQHINKSLTTYSSYPPPKDRHSQDKNEHKTKHTNKEIPYTEPTISEIITTLKNMENAISLLSDRIDSHNFPPSKTPPSTNTTTHDKSITTHSLTNLDNNIIKLEEQTQKIESLLLKSENTITQLQHTITNTNNMKKDLEIWHNSIFKSEDSEHINEIHQHILHISNRISTISSTELPPTQNHYEPQYTPQPNILQATTQPSLLPPLLPPPQIYYEPLPTPQPDTQPAATETSLPPHTDTTHVEEYIEHFVPPEIKALATDHFTNNCTFHKENGHETAMYGVPYHYTGSHSTQSFTPFPKPIAQLAKLLDGPVNNCLINRFIGPLSFMPEHSDNEKCITPNSKIYTLSFGETCTVIYTHNNTGLTNKLIVNDSSLYTMSLNSQHSWRHKINQETTRIGTRYSATFRYLNVPLSPGSHLMPTPTEQHIHTSRHQLTPPTEHLTIEPTPPTVTTQPSLINSTTKHLTTIGHPIHPSRTPASNAHASTQEQQPATPPKSIKQTVLITDSMMRHIEEHDLGTGHNITKINKTCMSQLSNQALIGQIHTIKPDFIYIHLGVNDILQQNSPNHTIKHLQTFLNATSSLKSTKIIISQPLLTGYHHLNHAISTLRQNIITLINYITTAYPNEKHRLYFNTNSNFYDKSTRSQQDPSQFVNKNIDYVHLSTKGKKSILANMRYVIHHLTRTTPSQLINKH